MLPGRKYTPDYILTLLWQGRRYLLIPAALGLVAALMVSRTYVAKYQADTLIQIVPQRVPDSFVKSTVTTNVEDRLKSIKQQIMSRTELERVVREFDLYPDLRGQSIDRAVSAVRNGIAIEPITERPGRRRDNEQIDAFTLSSAVCRRPRSSVSCASRKSLVDSACDDRMREFSSMKRDASDSVTRTATAGSL